MNMLGVLLKRNPYSIPVYDIYGKAPGVFKKCSYGDFDDLPTQGHYIYFLCLGFNVAYVGQSNVGVKDRIKLHARHLLFDKAYYMYLGTDLSRNYVNAMERKYIEQIDPCLNGVLTTFEKRNSGGAKTLNEICNWTLNNSVYYCS